MTTLVLQALRVGASVVVAKFLAVLLISVGVTAAGDVRITPSHYIVGSLVILGALGAYFGHRRYATAAVVTGAFAGVAISTVITVVLAPNVDSPTSATCLQPVLTILVACAAVVVGFGIKTTLSARRPE